MVDKTLLQHVKWSGTYVIVSQLCTKDYIDWINFMHGYGQWFLVTINNRKHIPAGRYFTPFQFGVSESDAIT